MKNRPKYKGCTVVQSEDVLSLRFFGGERTEGVLLTHDQVAATVKLYGHEPAAGPKELMRAGQVRATVRDATADGLRVIAWLAERGFLSPDEDPVATVAWLSDEPEGDHDRAQHRTL